MNSANTDQLIFSTHRRVLIVGAVIPFLIAGIATFFMVSWLPELPRPIAVHWSGAGPDGFGPALPFVLTPPAVVLAYSVFAVAMGWRLTPSGQLNYSQKFLVVTGVWLSAMIGLGFALSVASQRGLSDAHDAPDAGFSVLMGAVVGLVLAAGGWFLLPKGVVTPVRGQAPAPVSIHGEERVSWSHSARLGTPAFLITGGALLLLVGAVTVAALSSRAVPPVGVIAAIVIALLVLSNTWWRVSADKRGFSVRSVLGWPSKSIALSDIRTVQVSEVHPMGDFGGYGWRWSGGGRSGVILRAGAAIEVTAASGKRFVVTVDDAETGAGVLAALLAQHAAR